MKATRREREARRASRAYNLANMAGNPRHRLHGTLYGYRCGCRCDRCRSAMRMYRLSYNDASGAEGSGARYTEDDDAFILRHASDMTSRQIAGALGRTVSGISNRIRALRLRDPLYREGKPWTRDEDSVIATEYGRTPTGEIAGRLRRSVRAVYRRAEFYGWKCAR